MQLGDETIRDDVATVAAQGMVKENDSPTHRIDQIEQ